MPDSGHRIPDEKEFSFILSGIRHLVSGISSRQAM